MTYATAAPNRSRIDDIIFIQCDFSAPKKVEEREDEQLMKDALIDIVVYR
jgi:hypothetical protein